MDRVFSIWTTRVVVFNVSDLLITSTMRPWFCSPTAFYDQLAGCCPRPAPAWPSAASIPCEMVPSGIVSRDPGPPLSIFGGIWAFQACTWEGPGARGFGHRARPPVPPSPAPLLPPSDQDFFSGHFTCRILRHLSLVGFTRFPLIPGSCTTGTWSGPELFPSLLVSEVETLEAGFLGSGFLGSKGSPEAPGQPG